LIVAFTIIPRPTENTHLLFPHAIHVL
jgi:hypothetical protein